MGTRDEYVKSISSSFVAISSGLLKGMIVAEFPIFLNPILEKLLDFFINRYMTKLATATEMYVFFKYIDFRTVEQGRDFSSAALQNFLAQQNGTPEEKANAEKNLMDKFRALALLRS